MAARPIHFIGDFPFLEMQGVPDTVKRAVEVLDRQGVSGTAIWDVGLHSRPFNLRTSVDAETFSDALFWYDAYKNLIGGNPQPLMFRGANLSSAGLLFVVLDVRPIEIRLLARAVGGLFPPSFGWCQCEWSLLPVVVSSEE
jgi:hypothetical protein